METLVKILAAVILVGVILGVGYSGFNPMDFFASTTTTTSTSSTSSTTTTMLLSTTTTSTSSTTSSSTTTYRISFTIRKGTCYDGLQNQLEEGVDCGGPCPPCKIECNVDSDCGSPHYTDTFCLKNDVYKAYMTYDCLSPGKLNASCRMNKMNVVVKKCAFNQQCLFTDFCPEAEKCLEARCIYESQVCDWKIC